jgi:lysophospholipase L1-like esterase
VVQQYALAFADDPTSTVYVMNGGGNDILIPTLIGDPFDCLTGFFDFGRLSRDCQGLVADIRVDAVELLNQMAANGATDVLYLGYYYTKNGLIGRRDLRQAVDFGDDMIAAACRDSVGNCTFIDPRGVVTDADIVGDGVHPNASGSRKLADLIWPLLEPLL